MTVRQLFISYARENKSVVEALVRDLDALGYDAWFDFALRGGQSWWDEILRRIATSDAFLAVVSEQTLNSVACKRELEWAVALNKPILPLAVQRLPEALPRALSMRQIIDYSASGREAAIALAGALANLPAAPPPPQPLPEPPPIPLSYLSGLVDLVAQSETLTHDQQRELLIDLEPALRSTDEEERRAGHYVLEMFSKRSDLYADIDHNLTQLARSEAPPIAPAVAARDRDRQDEPAHRIGARAIALAAAAVAVVSVAIVTALLITRGGAGSRSSTGVATGSSEATTTGAATTGDVATSPAPTGPSPTPVPPPNVAPRGFTSPTGNIFCMIDPGLARCDIRNHDWSPPPRPATCPSFTGYGQGAEVQPGKPAQLVCAGDTTYNENGPLAYGDSIAAGTLQCTSRESSMSCRDIRSGHGFTLSREAYQLF